MIDIHQNQWQLHVAWKWSVLMAIARITPIGYQEAVVKHSLPGPFVYLRGRCWYLYVLVYNNSYLDGDCRDYVEDSQNSNF